MIKLRAEINEMVNRKTIEKMNKTKACFFEINKICKLLGILIKKKRTQFTNIRNEKSKINTDSTVIENIIREYYK